MLYLSRAFPLGFKGQSNINTHLSAPNTSSIQIQASTCLHETSQYAFHHFDHRHHGTGDWYYWASNPSAYVFFISGKSIELQLIANLVNSRIGLRRGTWSSSCRPWCWWMFWRWASAVLSEGWTISSSWVIGDRYVTIRPVDGILVERVVRCLVRTNGSLAGK